MHQLPKPSVLIVDDRANWRSLFAQLLEDEFEVYIATDYEDAVGAMTRRELPYHVIVTDLRLDDRDITDEGGLHLAGKLQETGVFTEMIVVTGYPTFGTLEVVVHPPMRNGGVFKQ